MGMTNTTDIAVTLPLTFAGRTVPGTVTMTVDLDDVEQALRDGDYCDRTIGLIVEDAELSAVTGDAEIDDLVQDGFGDNWPAVYTALCDALTDAVNEQAGNARDVRDQWASRGRAL